MMAEYHLIAPVVPRAGATATFAQMYLHDPEHQANVRSGANPRCNADMLRSLQDMMLTHNTIDKRRYNARRRATTPPSPSTPWSSRGCPPTSSPSRRGAPSCCCAT